MIVCREGKVAESFQKTKMMHSLDHCVKCVLLFQLYKTPIQQFLNALWLANSPEIEDNYINKWQNRYYFSVNEKCGSKAHKYTFEIFSCNLCLITHSYFLYRTILFWICILSFRSSSFGGKWDSSSGFNRIVPTCITYRSNQKSKERNET